MEAERAPVFGPERLAFFNRDPLSGVPDRVKLIVHAQDRQSERLIGLVQDLTRDRSRDPLLARAASRRCRHRLHAGSGGARPIHRFFAFQI